MVLSDSLCTWLNEILIFSVILVVDCGFVKLKWFNADTQTDALVVVPISQGNTLNE